MKRLIIFLLIIIAFFGIAVMIQLRSLLSLLVLTLLCIALAMYDYFQPKHSILRNFPLIGHIRYLFELIRPEIRQYFVASNQEEQPFNRDSRNIIYQRSKGALDTIPLGTQQRINQAGYVSARHSLKPTTLPLEEMHIMIGSSECSQPYLSSRLNVSAMSYGAISQNAILALNKGAKNGGFAHNTGEGGLSPYHLENGGDLIWQLGTAMFGCRTREGRFNAQEFQKKAAIPSVKMIEIKLSQGAKPSHGGILPAVKITPEIAAIRGIEMGYDCVSPPANPEFSTPEELLFFIKKLRELTDGKPIGFKLCIGLRSEFLGICKAILKTGILPDFITIDGAEGGTGAAPVEFADYLGESINEGLNFANNALIGTGLRHKIRLIANGKVATGFDMIGKFALGADICGSARAMMFALGCIQSLQCNKNTCPTGVTTQNPRLMRGLVVEDKAIRVANYHKATLQSCLELAGAMGVTTLDKLNLSHIYLRTMNNGPSRQCSDLFHTIEENSLLVNPQATIYARDWIAASASNW